MRPFRSELKFVIHHSVREMLLARWGRYLVRAPFTNQFAVTPILSQYYDSPTLEFYHEKLDGVAVRNKVRLRTYGYRYTAGATAFLEVKHRYNDQVRKYRSRVRDFQEGHLDPRTWQFEDPVNRNMFHWLLEKYRLRPSAQVFYLREAYEGAVESDMRITFDTCLIGLYPGEVVTPRVLHDRSRSLMHDTIAILEIKSTKGIPGWVHDGVVAAELQQKTIPKYITAVETLRMDDLYGIGVYA